MSQVDTVFIVKCDVSYEPVHGPNDVEELLDDDADMVNPQGTQGMSYFLGLRDSEDEDQPMREPVMRVDLDPETGAGALRWLPDGSVGVEDGYEPAPLRVCESSAVDLVYVPASIGRVSYGAARAAAERYIATGERPDGLEWVEVEPRA